MEKELMFNVRSLATGQPKSIVYQQATVSTAIHKMKVFGNIPLTKTQLTGDEQGDKLHHGGPDKAICAYCYENYHYWEQIYGRQLDDHQFGENLLIEGLTEDIVRIGDVYQFGAAVLQVSQPRVPCFKLAIRTGQSDIVQRFQTTGYTGYYLRVITPGIVSSDHPLILREKRNEGISVMALNKLYFNKNAEQHELEKIASLSELSEAYRKDIHKRIEKLKR